MPECAKPAVPKRASPTVPVSAKAGVLQRAGAELHQRAKAAVPECAKAGVPAGAQGGVPGSCARLWPIGITVVNSSLKEVSQFVQKASSQKWKMLPVYDHLISAISQLICDFTVTQKLLYLYLTVQKVAVLHVVVWCTPHKGYKSDLKLRAL